jgi:2-keto-4-pentenoate hydratase/2-oxohepta-3-ene-1,7-dioic acid hydratase in catechol pathway
LIEHLTSAFTLEPGDVISTGTPGGVGMASKPPRWLQAGDVVRIEIDRLGVLENRVVPEPASTVVY